MASRAISSAPAWDVDAFTGDASFGSVLVSAWWWMRPFRCLPPSWEAAQAATWASSLGWASATSWLLSCRRRMVLVRRRLLKAMAVPLESTVSPSCRPTTGDQAPEAPRSWRASGFSHCSATAAPTAWARRGGTLMPTMYFPMSMVRAR